MKFSKKCFLFFLLTGLFTVSSNCLFSQRHVEIIKTLEERLLGSEIAFEGTVTESVSFWSITGNRIFTRHTIEVEKLFKGER